MHLRQQGRKIYNPKTILCIEHTFHHYTLIDLGGKVGGVVLHVKINYNTNKLKFNWEDRVVWIMVSSALKKKKTSTGRGCSLLLQIKLKTSQTNPLQRVSSDEGRFQDSLNVSRMQFGAPTGRDFTKVLLSIMGLLKFGISGCKLCQVKNTRSFASLVS